MLCDVLRLMSLSSRKRISREELEALTEGYRSAMETMNRLLPKFAKSYCVHTLHHQPRQIELSGPRFAHSTLYGERFMRYLLRMLPESRRGQHVLSNKLVDWMSSYVKNSINEIGELHTRFKYTDTKSL